MHLHMKKNKIGHSKNNNNNQPASVQTIHLLPRLHPSRKKENGKQQLVSAVVWQNNKNNQPICMNNPDTRHTNGNHPDLSFLDCNLAEKKKHLDSSGMVKKQQSLPF